MASDQQECVTINTVEEWSNAKVLDVKNTSRKWRIYHETYTVCVAESKQATGEWFYRGKNNLIQHGELMLMEPGELHVTKKMEGVASFQTFFIDPDEFYRLAEEREIQTQPHFIAARLAQPEVYKAFRCLNNSLSTLDRLARESAWCLAINSLFEHAVENNRSAPAAHSHLALYKARDFLTENYSAKISLADLANVAGISRYHFIREFKQLFGLSPHAYLNEVRLSHLRHQLRRGVPVSEISIPYFDESHIHYHFKRSIGVTPKKYAKANKS